jgi:RNA polymerase sigma-70 factor, ECF subfamily
MASLSATDERLLRQLYQDHAGALLRYVGGLVGGDLARAEDVVQETLLRAWRNHDRLDESRGSVRSWLFTVARNIVIDEWRTSRAQHEVAVAEVPENRDDLDRTDQLLTSWLVAEAVTTLSADHRAVLLECYYRGASVAQAAHRLGIPEGTVKSRTHYALRALRLALQEMGVGA